MKLILVCISIVSLVQCFDRALILPHLPAIKAHWRVDVASMGYIVTYLVGISCFASATVGLLSEHNNRIYLHLILSGCWLLGTVLTLSAETFFGFLLAKGLATIGQSGVNILVPAMLYNFKMSAIKLNVFLTIHHMTYPIGIGLVYICSFVYTNVYSSTDLSAFYFFTKVTLFAQIIAFTIFVWSGIKHFIMSSLDKPTIWPAVKHDFNTLACIKYLVTNKLFIMLTCGYACLVATSDNIMHWLEFYIIEINVSDLQIGLVGTLTGTSGILLGGLVMHATIKINARHDTLIMTGGCFFACLGYIATLNFNTTSAYFSKEQSLHQSQHQQPTFNALMYACFIVTQLVFNMLLVIVMQATLYGVEQYKLAACSLQPCSHLLAACLGPLAGQLVAAYNIKTMYFCLALLLVLAGILFLFATSEWRKISQQKRVVKLGLIVDG